MADRQFTTVLEGGSFFEGPRWHEGSWWVSDFYRHTVSRVSADGSGEDVVLEVENQPSGLGWLPDGSLLVVSMKDQRLLRVSSDGSASTYADLSDVCGGHLNDLVVDASGRAFVGDFGFDLMGGGAPSSASVKRVDPDGTVAVVAEDLRFPNGSVITPDGGTLIVGETWGNRFSAFDIAADGSLTNRRVWGTFGPEPVGNSIEELLGQVAVAPDGCTLDADGHIWVADGFGSRVLRVAPGGEIVDEIAAPGGMGVYACALGGDDGRDLLMCCAPDFYEHTRAPVREAVLVSTEVAVPHAGLP
jgi:sugar lactone lactonase YvrE